MTQTIVMLLCGLLGLAIAAWFVAAFAFEAPDHSRFDSPRPALSSGVHPSGAESAEHAEVARTIRAGMAHPPAVDRAAALRAMRQALDERGAAAPITAIVTPVDVAGVPGEWVMPARTVAGRRLLYLHGGGYVMGSARSHRPITSRLAEAANAAVLAIDYRLLPEATRQDGIDDVRTAYRWLLANGPDGPGAANQLIVAGDSSGGNLALAAVAWARDTGLRQADCVIALSPHTDATFASPSLTRNAGTDPMQGPTLGPLVRAPRTIALWMAFAANRMPPRDPVVSPLFGDLANLPPMLLQVSAAEMFLDDAVRYANKARASGSAVVLQVWPHTLHAWHAFATPESDAAFHAIARFIEARLARAR